MRLVSAGLVLIFIGMVTIEGCALVEEGLNQIGTQRLQVQQRNAERVSNHSQCQGSASSELVLASLNLAHGRSTRFHQMLLEQAQIKQHLMEVASLFKARKPHIVALQEADEVSRWSGRFDHVDYLAQHSGYRWYAHGKHVKNFFGHYGTAIMSHYEIDSAVGHTFEPTPPTTYKGFTLAQIKWPHCEDQGLGISVDVISVHLDFSRSKKRAAQIREMQSVLESRRNPVVIMGDFNTEWHSEPDVLQHLAQQNNLTVHEPDATHLATFSKRRLDWILVSESIEIVDYHVVDAQLSDHRPVVATVRWRP